MVDFKLSREFFLLSSIVILGSFVFYNFVVDNFVLSFLAILFGVIYYFIYSIYIYKLKIKRLHSEIFIESTAVLSLFLFPMLAYGFLVFENMIQGIIILILFSIMQLVNYVKNWTTGIQYSKGFPIVLHGIFFPFTYFITYFYAESFEQAVFTLYFIITGILSATSFKFLNYQQSVFEDEFEDLLNPRTQFSKRDDSETLNDDKNYSLHSNLNVNSEDDEFLNSIESVKTNDKSVKVTNLDDSEFVLDDFDKEDEKFLNSLSKA